jgi:hypothetical protein
MFRFEPWMFAAMEDEGIMDTRTGRINRVAKFLVEQGLAYIGMDEFRQACYALGLDPAYFDGEDLGKIEARIRYLWGQ